MSANPVRSDWRVSLLEPRIPEVETVKGARGTVVLKVTASRVAVAATVRVTGTTANPNGSFCSVHISIAPLRQELQRYIPELRVSLERMVCREALPGARVTIILSPASLDGAAYGWLHAAATLALHVTGVPLNYFGVAIVIGLAPSGCVIVDPSTEEEKEGALIMVEARVPSLVFRLPDPKASGGSRGVEVQGNRTITRESVIRISSMGVIRFGYIETVLQTSIQALNEWAEQLLNGLFERKRST